MLTDLVVDVGWRTGGKRVEKEEDAWRPTTNKALDS
jgi:hypothetical protein